MPTVCWCVAGLAQSFVFAILRIPAAGVATICKASLHRRRGNWYSRKHNSTQCNYPGAVKVVVIACKRQQRWLGLRASNPPRDPKTFKKPVSVWQIDSAKGKLKPPTLRFNPGRATKDSIPFYSHNIFSLHTKFFFNFLTSNKSSQIW